MASWEVKRAELSTAEKVNKTAQCSELVKSPQFAIYHVGHRAYLLLIFTNLKYNKNDKKRNYQTKISFL